METIPVGLVGVTGYTGMELARLLAVHPSLRLVRATSRAEAGKTLASLYPFLQGFPVGDVAVTAPDAADLAAACRLVFLAVPHGAAMDYAAELLAAGLSVVDLSADFRLADAEVYAAWYGLPHRHPALLPEAVYGLPELYGERIKKTKLTANPGCYPTSVILGLAPALAAGLVETDGIVADSKSGASGAGRKAAVPTLFCEVHDSFRAYNLGRHRHTPEIEQELGKLAGADITVSFNPHLLPIDRGILSTIYTRLTREATVEEIHALYERHYADKPWVRVLPLGRLPETRHVRGTMFCDLGLVVDPRTGRLIVVSAIDNLCRGASGQAVACANLMSGLPVDAGLTLAPMMP
ncbi:N-acetyl-gamma-glutamyl-phosphate reductase [Solidesulfovibrio carbinoliphilus subsp. oakridgensis]|uniref:N-acetyl-gamma-glutamyl-phosphate reductase n=1 Tax=Solidesulfovibrio carbinoliphilus subsp. oakridgensis TaxID=694327 RepID=G7QAW3_9BACT|nr:N-acetyl-gamma-glutamyl-phosphate reductase [Solidesulfovibrio carbinoliphilus]EHJ48304.1 N-acetyl-gamma-glutamyl-phosphate reductase [Solidesulfovibrio carbinoliphilus subsp. oakridgensis]